MIAYVSGDLPISVIFGIAGFVAGFLVAGCLIGFFLARIRKPKRVLTEMDVVRKAAEYWGKRDRQ